MILKPGTLSLVKIPNYPQTIIIKILMLTKDNNIL